MHMRINVRALLSTSLLLAAGKGAFAKRATRPYHPFLRLQPRLRSYFRLDDLIFGMGLFCT